MKKQILLLNSDSTVAISYAQQLNDEDYRIVIATTCAAASALLEHWRPDLIVVDWYMPDLDGDIWASALRLRPDFADVPILMMIGRTLPRAALNRLNDYRIASCAVPHSAEAFGVTLTQMLRSVNGS
jgi:two-component system phosphate regulon response regulator PhoB